MTRRHDSKYRPPEDKYAHARCVNCRHLRYANQMPGEPCILCACPGSEHTIPGEVRP